MEKEKIARINELARLSKSRALSDAERKEQSLLRQEYLESTKLDTPMDWVCYILPVAAGILIQPHVNLKSEVLSWAIILLIVVVLFVFLQMVKPFFQKKKSTIQAIDQIKQYYYERYKKYGLDKMEPWN